MKCFIIHVVLRAARRIKLAMANAASTLQLHMTRFVNFMNFTKAYLKKNNPIKIFINQTVAYFKELAGVRKKLKRIQNRINYERYKLKKTELILAQNQDHVFLKGRSLNQTR